MSKICFGLKSSDYVNTTLNDAFLTFFHGWMLKKWKRWCKITDFDNEYRRSGLDQESWGNYIFISIFLKYVSWMSRNYFGHLKSWFSNYIRLLKVSLCFFFRRHSAQKPFSHLFLKFQERFQEKDWASLASMINILAEKSHMSFKFRRIISILMQ